jgi:hypothetical protein
LTVAGHIFFLEKMLLIGASESALALGRSRLGHSELRVCGVEFDEMVGR